MTFVYNMFLGIWELRLAGGSNFNQQLWTYIGNNAANVSLSSGSTSVVYQRKLVTLRINI